MNEKHILCLQCRSTFSDDEVKNFHQCPKCGNRGIPGDTRKTATVKLTEHEWRIIFFWAHRWAEQCDRNETDEERINSVKTIDAIMREARRQSSELQFISLHLGEEAQELAQELANATEGKVTMVNIGGTKDFEPEKKQ